MTIYVGVLQPESFYVNQVAAINEANGWGLPIKQGITWAQTIEYLSWIYGITINIQPPAEVIGAKVTTTSDNLTDAPPDITLT